jgi:hypothetical protein
MRVNSRLTDALLSNEFKFPAILNAHGHVANLVVTHFHEQCVHMGPILCALKGLTKELDRDDHAFVHSVLKDCFSCKLCNKAPEKQIMAPNPDFRHKSGGYAFETVRVDYFGPFNVKLGDGARSIGVVCLPV